MSAVTYDVTYTERRSRLTSAFRYLLALPHLIVLGVWGYVAELLAFLQWFVILFTGRRNEGMWDFQRSYLGYHTRVTSYVSLAFDEPYPNFGSTWRGEPVAFDLAYRSEANRLTNALRLIWMIPALFIALFLGIAQGVLLLVSWLVIIITGKQPARHVRLHRAGQPLLVRPDRLQPADDRRLSVVRGVRADGCADAGRWRRSALVRPGRCSHRCAAAPAVGPAGRLSDRRARRR